MPTFKRTCSIMHTCICPGPVRPLIIDIHCIYILPFYMGTYMDKDCTKLQTPHWTTMVFGRSVGPVLWAPVCIALVVSLEDDLTWFCLLKPTLIRYKYVWLPNVLHDSMIQAFLKTPPFLLVAGYREGNLKSVRVQHEHFIAWGLHKKHLPLLSTGYP